MCKRILSYNILYSWGSVTAQPLKSKLVILISLTMFWLIVIFSSTCVLSSFLIVFWSLNYGGGHSSHSEADLLRQTYTASQQLPVYTTTPHPSGNNNLWNICLSFKIAESWQMIEYISGELLRYMLIYLLYLLKSLGGRNFSDRTLFPGALSMGIYRRVELVKIAYFFLPFILQLIVR